MWHLILPPFIIIAGIGILLWFLSRRMDDPSFLSRVKSARGEVSVVSRSRALSRKAFFLKLLEKTASKFKTNSLRVHNFFQHSLEKLREKRKVLDEMRLETKMDVDKTAPTDNLPNESRHGWFGMLRKNKVGSDREDTRPTEIVTEVGGEATLEKRQDESGTREHEDSVVFGMFGKRGRTVDTPMESGTDPIPTIDPEASAPEPILKKIATRPERIVVPKKDIREERLIDHIAENPRDAASYEELGDLYLAGGNMQDAKACYRQVLKLHPTNRAVKLKIRKVERFFEKSVS
ncbi:MAG: hypothetical protein KBD19_03790 [Candidatus Moranbacteria bacterium]|nr:hypothetical protein [Candidatus Moranbacteria bacterium]